MATAMMMVTVTVVVELKVVVLAVAMVVMVMMVVMLVMVWQAIKLNLFDNDHNKPLAIVVNLDLSTPPLLPGQALGHLQQGCLQQPHWACSKLPHQGCLK